MSDLIDRKKLFDMIEWMTPDVIDSDETEAIYQRMKLVRQTIEALPSVQPEPSDVARNIATIIENEKDMRVVLQNSGQPEIIHCKDCKHRGREGKPIADGRYWCELHNAFMYYCSDAERRNDE